MARALEWGDHDQGPARPALSPHPLSLSAPSPEAPVNQAREDVRTPNRPLLYLVASFSPPQLAQLALSGSSQLTQDLSPVPRLLRLGFTSLERPPVEEPAPKEISLPPFLIGLSAEAGP